MCLKESERNILIFVVRLHYAITVCNAFQVASERKDLVAIKFNFDTFPELKLVLMELELDREWVVKCTNRKKTTWVKLKSELMDADQNVLMERLDQLESNLTIQFRKTFQDIFHAFVPNIDILWTWRYPVAFGMEQYLVIHCLIIVLCGKFYQEDKCIR
jgi:hypothetical protein